MLEKIVTHTAKQTATRLQTPTDLTPEKGQQKLVAYDEQLRRNAEGPTEVQVC
jgi:hypothetical protein